MTHSRWKTILHHYLPTVISIITLLIFWQFSCEYSKIPENSIPTPTAIAQATYDVWPQLWPATLATIEETVIGFSLAIACGILLGVLFHVCKLVHAALFPLLCAAQTLPLISIAPLFLIWFGFEMSGKIVIVAIFSMFPIAVQTIRGLDAVPSFYSDVALTCGAGRVWTLWHVKLRIAARQIFGGIRISTAYVFGAATTAEYLGARQGLGIWLQAAYNSFRTPLIFSATFVIIAFTAILMGVVNISERLLLGPVEDDEDPDNQM